MHPPGSIVGEYRNEDLERQTYADGSFDVVITQDVMEHIYDPSSAFREIARTLRPVGDLISSAFPS
jgi:2-polyprenyl-3-methyl-5-hydroxy-6-metoxy-1,4-benzoquinol methylase